MVATYVYACEWGELLAGMEKNKGAQGNPGGQGVQYHDETTQTLEDLGLTKLQSYRAHILIVDSEKDYRLWR